MLFTFIGCSQTEKQETVHSPESQIKKDSVPDNTPNKYTNKDSLIIPPVSGIVELIPENGKIQTILHKEKEQIIYIKFPSEEYKKLSARISSQDSKANIRISQIIMPNGKMDGPFGTEFTYDLPQQGTYGLLIHENQMAGDPWIGNFRIEIDLKK